MQPKDIPASDGTGREASGFTQGRVQFHAEYITRLHGPRWVSDDLYPACMHAV
jgi:hypothetical protein